MAKIIPLHSKTDGHGTAVKHAKTKVKILPKEELDRRRQLLGQFKIKNPLVLDDRNSVLTIDPGVGAAQVDTYAKVPKGSKHDGVFMQLTQTDWSSARVEDDGLEAQMTLPPRTMAGAFGFWAAHNGPMTLAGKLYAHSELDRQTGEVVLSDRTTDTDGNAVLEQRRLRPSNGTELSGDMLTTMPPKVGLVGFPVAYVPEPGLLAARPAGAKLAPGATLHVTGKPLDNVKADVTSVVRPKSGDWSNAAGAEVEIDTWLRVMNTDRAAIHHDSVVLRSAEAKKKGYYEDDDSGKPSTIHLTQLAKANLKVAPGESQEILVEKQVGRAHVEYRVSDSIAPRPAGEGSQSSEQTANRYMILENSKGKRHAGQVKFFDGINELGSTRVASASAGATPTTSDARTSGVIVGTKTTWSAATGAATAAKKDQTVTQEYKFSNISAVAGQLSLAVALEDFSEIKSIKINGKVLTKTLDTPEFTARLESERYGGSNVKITMKIAGGSETSPSASALKIEVAGKFDVEK